MRFVFLGAKVCRRLPSDSASRRTPLPLASGCHDQAPQRTFTSKSAPMPGALEKRPREIARPCQGVAAELQGWRDARPSICDAACGYANRNAARCKWCPRYGHQRAAGADPKTSYTVGTGVGHIDVLAHSIHCVKIRVGARGRAARYRPRIVRTHESQRAAGADSIGHYRADDAAA